MHTSMQVLVAVMLLAVSGLAQASPPPPPPPPPPPHYGPNSPPPQPASAFQACRDRSTLRFERSFAFQIRPCTIVATAKGRKLELSSVNGPATFTDAKGKRHYPTKVIFRSFVPLIPPTYTRFDMFNIKQTGRTLSVRLPHRLPSVLDPYVVWLPRSICRADTWLVSMAVSDGTETKPFGIINSMCGPNAPRPNR
jgi:hypothetical protein